jgi:hypothetical protein
MKDIIKKQEELINLLLARELKREGNFDIKIRNLDDELSVLKSKMEEVTEYQSGIVTVKERTIEMLNLGDNQNSVHDASIMDRYQNEAIRFLAEQIDKLHELRYKAHRDNLIKKG